MKGYRPGRFEVVSGGFVAPPVATLQGASMGTTWSVQVLAGREAERLRAPIEAALQLVVAQMSTWEAGSVLSRFNAGAAGSRHAMPAELAQVVECALDVAARSGGAFDPTVGPLVDLWGFGPRDRAQDGARRRPPEAAIAATRERCGYGRLERDGNDLLQPGGLALDLSAIAKGYAVDLVASRLRSLGAADALVEIGGELLAMGQRPDGVAWRVGIAAPRMNAGDEPVAAVDLALRDRAIATSGDHWNAYADDGVEYAHTIDPRTGHPAATGFASVTVAHRSCMLADAWATALTCLSLEEGYALAAREDLAVLWQRRASDGNEMLATPPFEVLLGSRR